MAIDLNNPMEVLEAEMQRAAEQKGGFAPFFFTLKDAEKALVRPLLNMSQYVMLNYHEKFNAATKKYEVGAVCALDFDQPCEHCKAFSEGDKKLKPAKRFYLPIYVHSALKFDAQAKKWRPLTYTDSEGNEQDVKGVRILEMKPSSSILADLVAAYNEDDSHDISRLDFVIARKGSGLDTEYTVTLKPDARPLPDDVPAQSREKIKSDVEMARPMRVVGDPVVASSNGKGHDLDIPEF